VKTLQLSKDLQLPSDVGSQSVAVFGIRGAGKTNTAGSLAEELLVAGRPIVVIDPTDAWWGLRAGRDGNESGGYPVVIFGGSHADVPLAEVDGRPLAEFLVHERVSAILSLRHLRKAAQRRFVTDFCEEIYHLKGRDEYRTPLTVFIDECPLFVPQKVLGDVARTVGAVEDLIARGRKDGFGVVLISQRSATVNADVRTQCDTIICHRMPAPLDRKAIREWFEENATADDMKEILQSLATLKDGEAWVWSPAFDIMQRTQMRMRRTFDSSATPKAGKSAKPPRKLAEIDFAQLKAKLGAMVERAKAEDPKALRARVAELERQLAERPGSAPQAVEVPVFDERAIQGIHAINQGVTELHRYVGELVDKVVGWEARAPRAQEAPRPAPARSTPRALPVAPEAPGDASVGTGGLRRMLVALAQAGRPLNRRALGLRAGLSSRSGTFATYLGRARSAGWIDGSSDATTITRAGLAALGSYERLPEGRELLDYWVAELGQGSGAGRMLAALGKAAPKGITRDRLGELAEISPRSGTFATYLGRLRGLELIEGKDELRISEELQ